MYGLRYGPREIWIGATDRVKEMKWVWVTGTSFIYFSRQLATKSSACLEFAASKKKKKKEETILFQKSRILKTQL